MIKWMSTSSLSAPVTSAYLHLDSSCLVGFALLSWNVSYFPFRAYKCLMSQESKGSRKPFSTKLSSQLAWEEMSAYQLKNPTAKHAASPWQHHEHNPRCCWSLIYPSPPTFSTCVPTRQLFLCEFGKARLNQGQIQLLHLTVAQESRMFS